MPVIGLLYDVHGNLPALHAVLADATSAGVERWVLGGDYALFGPWPGETLDAVRALPDAIWIRGNGERWSAHPAEAPPDDVVQGAITACRETLGAVVVEELASLPEQVVLDSARYCHASPVSDVLSFLPTVADDEEELLTGVSEPRLVFGHTHLPFRRLAATGIELVNPGSVGMPFDGDPRAAYAIIGDDGHLEHRRIPYDHEASATALRERFGASAWTATVAGRIVRARF